MLLQNTLDLSTFEIVRFRIWNQTSNPDDYGVGTKYFNTNSGHEGYNRENIYTDTGWRKTAYMDDIDKINEKLDLIFGDELDTDTIIDSWKEVQDFLSGIEDTKNLMTMLDGKLDKTGGTISGSLEIALNLVIQGRIKEYGIMEFRHPNGEFVYLANGKHTGVLSDADLGIYTGGTWKAILHSGNVGDYALKVDGSNQMKAGIQWPTLAADDWDIIATGARSGLRLVNSAGLQGNGAPNAYSVGLSVSGYYGFNIAYNASDRTAMFKGGITDSDWKTIAFTDSDITGNAATATKLATPRTIWGHDFDGTADVAGGIYFSPNGAALYVTSEERSILFLQVNPDQHLLVGQGIAKSSKDTLIYGNNIKFCYGSAGSSSQTAMTITEEGNVLVGVNDADDYTFATKNALFAIGLQSTTPTTPKELDAENLFSLVNTSSSRYGLHAWILNGGSANIQSARADGVNDNTYALNLNPLGGAVNVGEGGLNVAGNVIASKINSDVSISVENENGRIGLYTSENRGIYDFSKNMWVLGTNGTNTFLRQGNVIIGGHIDNESGAKLQVAGSATFSNRVLIGGAEDDGSIAKLQVDGSIAIGNGNDSSFIMRRDAANRFIASRAGGHFAWRVNGETTDAMILGADGLATFNGGALIPTGQTLTIGSVTFRETAEGEVEVDGNLHATGTLASGGKAQEGTGSTGGASGTIREFTIDPPTDNTSSFKLEHSFNTEKVIVQIFELNGNSGKYEMILTDVEITDANNVTVTFGRKPTEYHKVYVMA